jgi:hypothetical protein
MQVNAGVGTLESGLQLPKVERNPGQFLVFLKDFANLLTLAGLFCALLRIFFASVGNVSAAIIAMLWAPTPLRKASVSLAANR